MSYHLTIVCGNLGQDPEIRHTNNGDPVANFSVAVSEKRGGNETPTWYRCVAFKKTAEFMQQYLRKGDKVLVEGRMQERSWEDQSGQTRKAWELIANRVQSLGSKQREDSQGYEAPQGGGPASLDDEIPFAAEVR